jgi:uncharacterized protein YdeI (YjbR/CyaY-like superfamily)
MLEIVPLFSIPLAVTNVGPLDPLSLAWMKNLEFPVGQAARDQNDNDLPEESKGMYFLHKPQMKSLKTRIEKSIEEFINQLNVDLQLKITTSWLNKTEPGDWIDNHIHECSIISGVYYPEVDNTTSPIIFNKSNT